MAQVEWLIVGVTGALSAVLFLARGSPPGEGDIVRVSFALSPGDRNEVECASSESIEGHRCAYGGDGAPLVRTASEGAPLAPYLTTDRSLYLVPGLFEVPSVRIYASHHAPQQRFSADCKLRLVKKTSGFKTRFGRRDVWGAPEASTWVVIPIACEPRS